MGKFPVNTQLKNRLSGLVMYVLSAAAPFGAHAQSTTAGLRYLDNEQYGNAGAEFRKQAAAEPSAKNLYYLGYFYLRTQKPDSAKLFFQQGLLKDPNFALNTVGLGAVAINKGDKAAAKIEFEKALLATKSKNAEVAYAIGEAYTIYPTTDAPEAVRKLELATTLNAKNPEYFLTLGDAYLLQNDGSSASKNYELRALPLNPNYAKTYIKIGKLMERARNYSEAARKYTEGLSKDTGYSPGYRELGELYALANKPALALQNYEKYIRRSDRNPATMYLYADFLLRNKKYTEALAILKDLEANNKNPMIYRGFAFAYYETGAYADGLAAIQKLTATYDTTNQSNNQKAADQEYYGKLLIKGGKDTSGGIARLHRAAALDTTNAVAIRTELAKLLMDSKKYKLAAEEYAALADAPKGTAYDRYNQGMALFLGKEYVQADTVIGTAVTQLPNPGTALYLKGQIATKLDPEERHGKAKSWYERYIQTITAKPEDIEKNKSRLVGAYLYLGYYHLKHKDKAGAEANYNKVLELDPNNATAKQGLTIDPNKQQATPAQVPAKEAPKKEGAAPAKETAKPAKSHKGAK